MRYYLNLNDRAFKAIINKTKRVEYGNGGSDFYLDEGLMKKLESLWEEPTEYEYDVIYKVDRKKTIK